MQGFKPEEPKRTDGIVDPLGMHYSMSNWKGRVRALNTNSSGKEVKIGISDFEFFGTKGADKKRSARRLMFGAYASIPHKLTVP